MGQRHKTKREPKGTGQADPTKDRSDHEAARGRKAVTLNDLSRQLPSEDDLSNYHDRIWAESDRGAAVMAAALVERALEDRIRSKLHDPGGGVQESWFESHNAPFRTFSAKIALGRALELYDADIEELLTIVKNIRNAFAHCMSPLDFKHPTLVKECQKLKPTSFVVPDEFTTKQVFGISCLTLARSLGMRAVLKAHLEPTSYERGLK